MLNIIMLSVNVLNVIMLYVIILSVVAHENWAPRKNLE
jgi:hypothetical protein